MASQINQKMQPCIDFMVDGTCQLSRDACSKDHHPNLDPHNVQMRDHEDVMMPNALEQACRRCIMNFRKDRLLIDNWQGLSKEDLLALPDFLPAGVRDCPRAYLVKPRQTNTGKKNSTFRANEKTHALQDYMSPASHQQEDLVDTVAAPTVHAKQDVNQTVA
ncbi:hypothetical protein D6C84_02667 [Aureobasidium pullulans]|uniref:C3H1-type domain-containing protein n=1 Tax=Aureobasidium pullulans TaxID=5580 RepID=A0A4S9Y1Q7_AURPU|nr:hypothetical protein D6C84_02667 [Aureobasidium pullulans]